MHHTWHTHDDTIIIKSILNKKPLSHELHNATDIEVGPPAEFSGHFIRYLACCPLSHSSARSHYSWWIHRGSGKSNASRPSIVTFDFRTGCRGVSDTLISSTSHYVNSTCRSVGSWMQVCWTWHSVSKTFYAQERQINVPTYFKHLQINLDAFSLKTYRGGYGQWLTRVCVYLHYKGFRVSTTHRKGYITQCRLYVCVAWNARMGTGGYYILKMVAQGRTQFGRRRIVYAPRGWVSLSSYFMDSR